MNIATAAYIKTIKSHYVATRTVESFHIKLEILAQYAEEIDNEH
jgi:hypothetical protein